MAPRPQIQTSKKTTQKTPATPNAHSALHQLHRAGQLASDLFANETQGMDITPRQLVVLQSVMAEEGLSQTDLVNRTGIDRSTIADIVRRMQTKGLIKRKRTKSDARVYAVSLTEKSRKILVKAVPAASRADEALLAPLNETQRARLFQYLGKIADSASS